MVNQADTVETPFKESQILDGAARVFAGHGYEGASMSNIAAEAGVSKGTLYNYFPGKAELFVAYMQRECSRWIALVFDTLDPSMAPAETLRQVGRRIAMMMLSEPALIIYRMVVAEAVKFPSLAETFYAEGPARSMCHLADVLRCMADNGALHVADPDFAAEQFFTLIQARLLLRRRLALIPMPDEAEIDHVVGCAVELFMKGFGV